MKHYIHKDKSIWAFEINGSQDHLITDYMTPISDADLYALRNPQPTPEQLQSSIVQATQQRLDDFAKTRNYDSILSACTYATSAIEKFGTEGQDAVNARDVTWATLYDIMSEVEHGTRPMPTNFSDIESLLPILSWSA